MVKKKYAVNWEYSGDEVLSLEDMPPNTMGFIYRINNLTTGKYYIGRRTVASKKKKKLTLKEKALPENKRKTFKYEVSESAGWKTYCGSNIVLKEEVAKGHLIEKEILTYCFTKAQISLEETKAIICGGALEDKNSYNGWCKVLIYKKHLLVDEEA